MKNVNGKSVASGCLAVSGWLFVAVAVLMIAFGVHFWFYSDEEFERRRQESQQLAEQAHAEWEAQADFHEAELARYDSLANLALERGDTLLSEAYNDSACVHIESSYPVLTGFPMGGMVSIFVFIAALVPLALGISLLIAYYVARSRRKDRERREEWLRGGES